MNRITATLSTTDIIALTRGLKNSDISSVHHTNETATEHSGQVAVLLDYSFKVGADEVYTPTVHTPLKAVLAILAEESPEMAQKIGKAMNTALKLQAKAQSCDVADEMLKSLLKDAPTATANVDSLLASLPKATRRGKIHAVKVDALALDHAETKKALIEKAERLMQAQMDEVKKNFEESMKALA